MTDGAIPARIDALAWDEVRAALDAHGVVRLPPLLDAPACAELAGLFDDDTRFRNRVVMQRHGYGSGEYRYFTHPLPATVAALRRALYAQLAPLARAWAPNIGTHHELPDRLDDFLAVCAQAGQTRPTPLLLRYRAGDWNALHRDLYGDVVFPFQVTVMLSPPEAYDGGTFAVVEQRPRAQSRVEVVPLRLGEAVVFTTRDRPVPGTRGTYRVGLRHGVSTVTRGERIALGVIFHDAA